MELQQRDTRLADLTQRLEAIPRFRGAKEAQGLFSLVEGSPEVDPAVLCSLQLAMEIELATLPPYLCALWSIKPGTTPVRGLILGICMNEMLHLGLAGNMLKSLGGEPKIRDVYYTHLGYPKKGLPGGVLPDLVVDLGSLTRDRVANTFQVIETPEQEIAAGSAGVYTIGRFYDALQNALPSTGWAAGKPITDAFITPQISSIDTARRAIDQIKLQGEGSSANPYADAQHKVLAHFYAFEQIARENRIVGVTGDPPQLVWADPPAPDMQFPPCYDMQPIDVGGRYLDPPPAVAPKLQAFNAAWDKLLVDLEAAWQNDDLETPKNDMSALQTAAEALFSADAPDPTRPNLRYGPEFTRPL